jgi:hypothetical protein
MNTTNAKPYRLLILCWGYSIHARRRAQLFIDDPRFEVTVVSTHNYAFEKAENVLLTAARRAAGAAPSETRKSASSLLPAPVRAALKSALNLLGLVFELRTMARDLACARMPCCCKHCNTLHFSLIGFPPICPWRSLSGTAT